MLIDTHTHLNFSAFDRDRHRIIKKCLENNIWIINVGTQYSTSEKAVEIANNYKQGVFSAIGLHPLHLEESKIDKLEIGCVDKLKDPAEKFDKSKYKALARSDKVVAIGEIGLDYYYKPKTKKKLITFKQRQKDALLEQIHLAQELDLPIIFHCRMAHSDLIEILEAEIKNNKIKGVIHSFVGTKDEVLSYLKMGFYIGFNGIIFKKIQGIDFEENIKTVPLNRILLETDSPYLSPPDFGHQRNNSLAVKYVAERIAEIRGINFEKISEITSQNAKNLFKL